MVHVFCLGPLELGRDGASYAAFAVVNGRMEQPIFAGSEAQCLGEVRRRHPDGPHLCEPDLAALGARLGYQARALPDEMLAVRAGLAVTFAAGQSLAPGVGPPFVAELLAASSEFMHARPWERIDSEALVHVRVEGVITATWEASVLGSGGREYGIGLYLDPGTHARMHATRVATAAAELRKRLSTLAVTFDGVPAFAAQAIEDRTGVPFVPVPLRVDKGRLRPVEAKHLVVLCACLRAATSADGTGASSVGKIAARVSIRRAPKH